jgi:hypothetical protein
MDPSAVAEKLIQVHREIQEDCGYDPAEVTPDCRPLDGLPGFDSVLIPGTVRALARALGMPLPKGTKIKNIYVTGDGRRKHSIKEVAQAFCRTYGAEGKKE